MNSTISEEAAAPAGKTDDKLHGHQAIGEHVSSRFKRNCAHADAFQVDALRKAREAAVQADAAIREHPYGAIGIVTAAALIIGLLAVRR